VLNMCFVCVVSSATTAGAYTPPLAERMPLTSTFGEYRFRHFHGGVDFSTGGETGMDVFAVAPGYVWRIRISGAGYGRALYMNLDDGRTAVYAHLNDFAPRIEEVAAAEQRRVGGYRIDYILPDRRLKVREGELIAHTGESGAGPPHFHFELRRGEVQINPLEAGIVVTDTRPPRLRSLILIPLGSHSKVDGRREPLEVGLKWDRESSTCRTSRTPAIQGDVAVACRVYDLADGKPNKLALYGAALFVDGAPAYDVRFDAVPLSSTHHVELVYNYDCARRGGPNVLNLFGAPGRNVGLTTDETPLRGVMSVAGSGSRGPIRLEHGRHEIRVEAWDHAGNRRCGEMTVIANNRPSLVEAAFVEETGILTCSAADPDGDAVQILVESSNDAGDTWSAMGEADSTGRFDAGRLEEGVIVMVRAKDEFDALSTPMYFGPGLYPYAQEEPGVELRLRDGYVECVCAFDLPAAHSPALWLVNGEGSRPITPIRMVRDGPAAFRAAVPLADSLVGEASLMVVTHCAGGTRCALRPLSMTYVGPEAGGDAGLPGGAVLALGENTFPGGALVMSAFEDSFAAGPYGELVPLSKVFRCEPEWQFFERRGTLYLPLERKPSRDDRAGLYQRSGERSWSWVGSKRRDPALVGGDISHFSVFALMEDVEAPRVTRITPSSGDRVRASRPTLRARLSDKGSGLDWDEVYFTIDGGKLITAWEADYGAAWVRVPFDLSPGPHSVELHAADRAGNETTAESTFTVVR
jgi:hypothetical protein